MIKPKFKRIGDVVIPDSFFNRLKTGIESLDFFFNQGILPGSSMTLTALPGTGKTQLCLQMLEALSNKGFEVGFTSNEESIEQIAFTSKRIGVVNVPVGEITSYKQILDYMKDLDLIVVDSFSVLQVDQDEEIKLSDKQIVNKLVAEAKETNCAIIFIMHLTKDGKMKGSTYIPHKVDANIIIEKLEDADPTYRRIFFTKNRFGPPNDITLTMTSRGYDFAQVDSGETAPSEKRKKRSKMTDALKVIEGITEPPHITLERVMATVGCNSLQAGYYLRELCLQGTLIKIGRGNKAIWKFKKVVDKSNSSSIINVL